MRSIIKCSLFIFFAIFAYLPLHAQVDRVFWFTIPKENNIHASLNYTNNVGFKVAALSQDAKVTISMPANPSWVPRTKTILAGTSDTFIMATTYAQFATVYSNRALVGDTTRSGRTNRGILIVSDNDITVYYDYNNTSNEDIFSLKGKNALGTEFYTPFQYIWLNDSRFPARSDINIVATMDGTSVTIDNPTVSFQDSIGVPPKRKKSITVTLNRGQTFTVAAYGQNPLDHLTGTHITSTHPIAVTLNDDSQQGAYRGTACADVAGDQIIPTNVIGSKYLVMPSSGAMNDSPGLLPTKDIKRADQIIITATQPGTKITLRGRNGTQLDTVTLGTGGSYYYSIDTTVAIRSSIYVAGDNAAKPFYVFHITGISCETGGAILPPITDCTGSSEVSFVPSSITSSDPTRVSVNLMVPFAKKNASGVPILFTDPSQSDNYFTLFNSKYPAPTGFHIPATWFEANDSAGWAVLQLKNRNLTPYLALNEVNKIVNDSDFFHLGMTNGAGHLTGGTTNKYGYFSSFNAAQATVRVASTETQDYIGCFGQNNITLVAGGGLSYKWHYGSPTAPSQYLNDPTSATPHVDPSIPSGSHNFYVQIIQSKCFGVTTLKINVTILPKTTARFEVDKSSFCAIDTVKFTNQSVQASDYTWLRQINNGAITNFTRENDMNFTQLFKNPTSNPITYKYFLTAATIQGCQDTISKVITVLPEIYAGFKASDTIICNDDPRQPIKFTNKSTGNLGLYTWDFGDQGSAIIAAPDHQFSNYGLKDTFYTVKLVVKSPFYCTDTATQKIHVHPYINASFTVDTVRNCSPFIINVFNNSQGPISSYLWDFGDGTATSTTNVPHFTHLYTNTSDTVIIRKLKLTVQNLGGCIDTLVRYIKVYPQVVATFSVPSAIGCNEFTVKFTNNTNAAATSFVWDFGDGSTSNLKSLSHLFVNNSDTDQVYKVKLAAYSPDYCTGYDSINITVHAKLDPQFALDVPKTCAPYNATFTNKSTGGITSYSWDYGDGTLPWGTSGASSFQHRYNNTTTTPVTYTAKLVIANSGGCKDSVSQSITLYPEVNAQFSTIMSSFCSPRKIDFANHSSASATKFYWNFGDNTSSLAKDTSHIYLNNTQDTVYYHTYLVAISDYNCRDSTASIPVLVYPYIEANFALDTTAGCDPLTVKITKGSLGPYDEEYWSFGDLTLPLTTIQPAVFSHVFYNTLKHNDQPFKITYNIKYKGQCQTGIYKWVTVYPPILPMVSVNKTTVCNDLEITFRDSTTRNYSAPFRYEWDFGDDGTAVGTYGVNRQLTVVTKHQFENYGLSHKTLTATFTGYSEKGCSADTSINIVIFPDVKANFSFNNPDGCSPFKVPIVNGLTKSATWVRFWDDKTNPSAGFPTTSLPASQTYLNPDTAPKSYTPKLKVAYLYPPITGSPVCPDSITHTLLVYPKATAYFSAKDSFQICNPDSVHFANRSMIASYQLLNGDKRLSYKWTFGDNGSSSEFEPGHYYQNYSFDQSLVDNVWLKVGTKYGCTDSLKRQVIIYPKPKAVFDIDNTIDCPPFKVEIDHNSVAESGTRFDWIFHYGNDTSTKAPVETFYHTFSDSGSTTKPYIIDMLATTPHNCTTATSQEIDVYPRVVADFEKDTAGCHPFAVTFKDKSKQADYWDWTFGDGGTSKSQSPKHTFLNNSIKDSSYTVTLTATSKFKCFHDTTHKVTVYPQPVANFEADPSYFTFSPTSNIVTFTNSTNPGNWNYLWNFGDLLPTDNSMGPILKHDYQYWGYYDAKLNVWSAHCKDSISRHITIVPPKPIAEFSASANGCVPLTVTFTELTRFGTSWIWDFGDGGTYTGQNPPPYEYVKAGKFNVKLTVTGDGGTSYAYKDIEVFPKPTVNFDLKPHLVMLTETKTNGESSWGATVNFYNKCVLGNTFSWDFGDSTAKSNEPVPTHTYKAVGSYTVKLGAWTVNQCYDEIIKKDTVIVLDKPILVFPNAFMPVNGMNDGTYDVTSDTKNEVFHPSWQNVVEFHMEIYDRWGEKLFETDDITVGWNGYYKGKLCKTDVYIWKAKGKFTNGTTFDKAGNVTLLR